MDNIRRSANEDCRHYRCQRSSRPSCFSGRSQRRSLLVRKQQRDHWLSPHLSIDEIAQVWCDVDERKTIRASDYVLQFRRRLNDIRGELNARKDILHRYVERDDDNEPKIDIDTRENNRRYDSKRHRLDSYGREERNGDRRATKRRFYELVRDLGCYGREILRVESVADVVNRSAVKLAEMDETYSSTWQNVRLSRHR